ncbi:MAG: DUF2207 domain-containing protein [Clostridia bacterium]|nr:DUF2207 domain-containing protein [Clostridia bacterium]
MYESLFRGRASRVIFLILSSFALVLLLASCPTYANYDLEITQMKVNIVVNEDNTYNIEETLDVSFNRSDMHGIFRAIPIETYFGKQVKISSISVPNHKSETEYDGGFLNLKIGDPDIYARSSEKYVIRYKYEIGDDRNSEMDELYFNIVGVQWEIPIHKTVFTIVMPKAFNGDKLNFTSGYTGSSDGSKVTYDITGNIISGELNETLIPGQALTIALPLDEGYFSEVKPDLQLLSKFSITFYALFPILFLAAIGLWMKFGKDDPIYPTVEFYPPKDLTPAEIGYIIDGKIDPYDLTAMLVYWANLGYIKIIEEVEEVGLIFKKNKSNMKLQKIRNLPDEAKPFEKIYFNGLFDNYAVDDVVEIDDLKDSFYVTLAQVSKKLLASFKGRGIFSKEGNLAWFGMIVIGIMILMMVFIGIISIFSPYAFWSNLIFSFIGSVLIGIVVASSAYLFTLVKTRLPKDRIGVVLGALSMVVITGILTAGLLYILEVGWIYWVGVILAFLVLQLSPYAQKRTQKGNEWLAQLLGLKAFIENAEKNRILTLIEEDPDYFYNVLPYAMVLGVTDKWADSFESITMNNPDWYVSNSQTRAFSAVYFASNLNSKTAAIGSTMVSTPSRSGGGSFGGGSSGGGSGGGGGGGW